MRTFIFVFPFLIMSSIYAQQTETVDVIYLNDGSIIKGRIIEVIPSESIKISTLSGSILIFQANEVKSIKREKISFKNTKFQKIGYNSEKYLTQINTGRIGLATVTAITLIGSAAMGDEMFATTVIPVVGPFITIIRVENDPGLTYLSGGKTLLLTSGILQVSFFAYWMYYLVKDSNYKSEYGISFYPNSDNLGFTFSYRF